MALKWNAVIGRKAVSDACCGVICHPELLWRGIIWLKQKGERGGAENLAIKRLGMEGESREDTEGRRGFRLEEREGL